MSTVTRWTRDKRKLVAWMSASCGITNVTQMETGHILNCLKSFMFDNAIINQRITELNGGMATKDIMAAMLMELIERCDEDKTW